MAIPIPFLYCTLTALHTKWDLSSYAGLLRRHPALIGGTLLRDFRRQRDDASVLVVKAA